MYLFLHSSLQLTKIWALAKLAKLIYNVNQTTPQSWLPTRLRLMSPIHISEWTITYQSSAQHLEATLPLEMSRYRHPHSLAHYIAIYILSVDAHISANGTNSIKLCNVNSPIEVAEYFPHLPVCSNTTSTVPNTLHIHKKNRFSGIPDRVKMTVKSI